jgi:hypothetical protein
MRDDWNGSGSCPVAVFGTGRNETFLLAEIQHEFNQIQIISLLIHTTSVY